MNSMLIAFPVALPLAGAAFVAFADDWTPEWLKGLPATAFAAGKDRKSVV